MKRDEATSGGEDEEVVDGGVDEEVASGGETILHLWSADALGFKTKPNPDNPIVLASTSASSSP